MRPSIHPSDVARLRALIAEVNQLRRRIERIETEGVVLGESGAGASGQQIIRVRLTQTGGSAGDASTQCSFTYSVYLWSDTGKVEAVATNVPVIASGGRASVGKYIAATHGLVVRETTGAIVLLWTNESQDTGTGCV